MSKSEKPEKEVGEESQMSAESNASDGNDSSALSGKISANFDLNLNALPLPGKKVVQALGAYVGYAQGAARAAEMKKNSEAHAHSMIVLAEAYKRATDLVGDEKADEIKESLNCLALRQRAGRRVIQQEMQRQQNIDSVAWQAIQKLPEKVSEEPVKPDWVARFIESIKDVSDEAAQKLWASILAGEVTSPGKFSLRTMDVLKNLLPINIQDLIDIANYQIDGRCVFCSSTEDSFFNKIHVATGRILSLVDCGLMMEQNRQTHRWGGRCSIEGESATAWLTMKIGDFMFIISGDPYGAAFNARYPVIHFTLPGMQLLRLIDMKMPSIRYIQEIAMFLNSQGVVLRAVRPMTSQEKQDVWKADINCAKHPTEYPIISPTDSPVQLQELFRKVHNHYVPG